MQPNLQHAALLVIDVQQEMFEKSTPVHRAEQLVANISSLVRAAQQSGVPVIYIQHSAENYLVRGTPGWEFHPALRNLGPDVTIHKRQSNAFEETELDAVLKARGVDTLIITGMVTHGCVKNTALGGLAAGYRVVVVSDAHSSYSQKAARLIEEWNADLQKHGALLLSTAEIRFGI